MAEVQTKTLRRLAFSTLIGTEVIASIINVETQGGSKVILAAEEVGAPASGGGGRSGGGSSKGGASAGVDRAPRGSIESVKVGETVEATVKAFADYGAFVELEGSRLKGIIHISELSWNRVGHPSSVLSIGQHVRVQVVSVDVFKGKVALSLRRTQPDPLLMSLDSVIDRVTSSGAIAQPLKEIECAPRLALSRPVSAQPFRSFPLSIVGGVMREEAQG